MAPAPIASSRAMIRTDASSLRRRKWLTSASTARISSGGHRPGLAEVEAQPVGGHQRALLRHVPAEMTAQGRVEQVRRRMGAADAVAARGVGLELDRVADRQRPALEPADMDPEIAQPLLRVGDLDQGRAAADGAGVADLAAGFAVERGLVGDHHDRAGLGARDGLAVDDQGGDHALGPRRGVAQELGRPQILAQVEPDRLDRGVARALPGGTGGLALARHGGVEAVRVDGAALGAQGILGQVEREAVSVVELEGDLAGQRGRRRQPAGLLLEQAQAALERAAEAGLLELEDLGDQRLGAHQLGERLAHLVEQHRHHLPQDGLAGPQQLGVAHAAAHDPAQDVAAALVGRHDAVGDQEGGAAQMVGDHLVRRAAVAHGMGAGQRHRGADQRLEHVDVVIVGLALQHGGDALEAHAGVDRGPRQVQPGGLVDLLVLHEDEVPDLDPAVAVLVRAAGRAARDVRRRGRRRSPSRARRGRCRPWPRNCPRCRCG